MAEHIDDDEKAVAADEDLARTLAIKVTIVQVGGPRGVECFVRQA